MFSKRLFPSSRGFLVLFSVLTRTLLVSQELPAELLNQPACQEILAQYGQSFKDVLSFENIPNNPESHEIFNQMLTNIRQRHQASKIMFCILGLG